MLEHFHILAFTHKNMDVSEVGKLHIETDKQKELLTAFKKNMTLDELMFLSTCNRVEFLFTTKEEVNAVFLFKFFKQLYQNYDPIQIDSFVETAELYSGDHSIAHILQVASSIDSMIVGEREIITQVRNAFEASKSMGLTGDFIRLVMRHTVETAKKVYTETSIANKPVSVVALAYHTLRDMNISLDARVLMIGAGMTNSNMAKFLKKHGFKNFTVFNRTVQKAESLANELHGEGYGLDTLKSYTKGFDIIITCTGSELPVITPKVYQQLLQGETSRKVVIDIAIPHDLDAEIVEKHNVTHISIDYLQKISDKNLQERSKEIVHVEQIIEEAIASFQYIHRMRKVEIAMREVPNMVKDIRSTAVNEVFKKELQSLDDDSREVLDKIIGYMEKKYMSMPMKLAKDIMLNS
ncbi:MAG: glutamyl-tRNA reductase [Crocinitomicaceae bacterium]|nr:glutamyl-tRNA reductase [Crocinitomicaceae bacterium]